MCSRLDCVPTLEFLTCNWVRHRSGKVLSSLVLNINTSLFMSFFYNLLSFSVSVINRLKMVIKQINWTLKHLQVYFK